MKNSAIKIPARIKGIASWVPQGAVLADIGTDHAYLPKYLLDQGKIKKAYACDLNKGPLEFARENLHKHIEEGRAQICLGDGLAALKKEDGVDCLVIAGMGGILISKILSEGKDILSGLDRLILSPNNGWDKLRDYLCNNGMAIIDEDLLLEEGHFYPIIIVKKGDNESLSPAQLWLGPRLLEKKHPLLREFYFYHRNKTYDKNSDYWIERGRYLDDFEVE